jgi:apolipoprotein N-acyltransferase
MNFFGSLIAARGFRADLIALLAGALAALALPPLHMLPVLLVAFPLLLAQIDACEHAAGALRRGWWFGFGYHLLGLYWITEAILFEAARFWWLVPLAVPAVAAVLAVFIAIPVCAAWFVKPAAARVLVLAGTWVLAELARQFVATGFPWNPLGSVWAIPGFAGDVMLQPASLVSVHGLTLITVVLACAPVLRLRGRAACLGILLVWIGFGLYRTAEPSPPDQPLRVVLVQGNVPQGQKWDPALLNAVFDRYLHLTDEGLRAAGSGPRLAVWPETASPFQLGTDAGAREAIAAASNGVPVLAGAVRFDADVRPRNALFAVTGAGSIAAVYDKWHLVPFGEYQPDWLPIGIQLVPGGGFARGPGPATLRIPGVPPVGPLICYEAIFPGQVVDEADRPEWMVNVTNDAWFGTSSGPRQHLAAARLRAVEEGLPLLRAANTGITVAFDSKGREITRLEMEQTGFRTVTLPGPLPPTVFARFGLAVPGVLSLCLAVLGFLMKRIR